jgi:HK97 family phage portal protein
MGLRRWLFGEPEVRAITSLPWGDSSSVPFNVGPGRFDTPADALSLASVYSAVRLIGQSVSTLPMRAYRRGGEDRVPMPSLPQLFAQLTTDGQLVPWLHRCVASLALRGNAYGYVVARDGFGFPTQIEWLDPSEVYEDSESGSGWRWRGRILSAEEVVHIPWFTVPGKRCGLSPIASMAATLGVGLQAQTYASDWFAAGGFPPGTFKNEKKEVTPAQATEAKNRFGAAIRSHTPMVFGADWTYTPISVPADEAQFVQTMKLTTNQIASIYGIPPEMIGGESGSSMTYANVEQQQINFVMFTLRPWLVTLESAFSALLPDRQYVKLNSDALIRADLQTRWNVNKIRVDMGAANIDEIRAQEDQPPLPNGQGKQYGPSPTPIANNDPSTADGVVPMRRNR